MGPLPPLSAYSYFHPSIAKATISPPQKVIDASPLLTWFNKAIGSEKMALIPYLDIKENTFQFLSDVAFQNFIQSFMRKKNLPIIYGKTAYGECFIMISVHQRYNDQTNYITIYELLNRGDNDKKRNPSNFDNLYIMETYNKLNSGIFDSTKKEFINKLIQYGESDNLVINRPTTSLRRCNL